MFQTFVITLREGVEAALVIAIAIAYLRKTGRTALLPVVYKALLSAVIACFIGAWALDRSGLNPDIFGGYTLLIGSVFVASMVVWMNRHGKTLKREIESRLQEENSGTSGAWGVFGFVFLMVLREGVETVLLLWTVRLDTSGILEWGGAIFGIALAVLFGVSFVRGTVRIDLRQFFRITSVILMVVAAQLAITGLHELSESGVLPSSKTEMALIGPVVRNDVFFFITILLMAAVMLLMEWRKRKAPATQGLEGAALRKAAWSARRERLWMTASCAASCLFILLITAEFIYARDAAALSAATTVGFENGSVRIPVNSVNDGNLHRFLVADQGVNVRFIVLQKPDRTLAVAFDACMICGPQGYYQKGPEVICRNCSSEIVIATIGTPGGCNPIALDSKVEGDTLVIAASALERGAGVFRKG